MRTANTRIRRTVNRSPLIRSSRATDEYRRTRKASFALPRSSPAQCLDLMAMPMAMETSRRHICSCPSSCAVSSVDW